MFNVDSWASVRDFNFYPQEGGRASQNAQWSSAQWPSDEAQRWLPTQWPSDVIKPHFHQDLQGAACQIHVLITVYCNMILVSEWCCSGVHMLLCHCEPLTFLQLYFYSKIYATSQFVSFMMSQISGLLGDSFSTKLFIQRNLLVSGTKTWLLIILIII